MTKALLTPFVALLLAAGLLWTLLPLLYPDWVEGEVAAAPQVLAGKDFSPVVAAAAKPEGSALLITRMQQGEAVFRANTRFDAALYPQLRLQLDGIHPGLRLFLFWRVAEEPAQQRVLQLEGHSDGARWYSLGHSELWQGTVVEIAVGAFGQPGPEPLRLQEVALHGATRGALVARMLAEWTSFQPWQSSAMNLQRGAPAQAIVAPNVVGALGAGIALLLLAIAGRLLRLDRRTVVAGALLVLFLPWLLLDLLWQGQLNTRVALSREHFGGLDQQAKHQREPDAVLFNYAQQIRSQVPADPRQRLFLLHDSRGHNYQRLRLQFHLLPLNIYNFGSSLLPPGEMRPGDHVLQLGSLEGLRYDPASGVLEDDRQRWQARLLDQREPGRLFRLLRPLPAATLETRR